MNLMVTINQKLITDTHTQKRMESKHNAKDGHQIKREESERRKLEKRTIKTIRKQQNVSKYTTFYYMDQNKL